MLAAQAAFVPPVATEESIRSSIDKACAQSQAAFAPYWVSQPAVEPAAVARETISSLAAYSPPPDVTPPPAIGQVCLPHAAPVELFYFTAGAAAPAPVPEPPRKARFALHRNLLQIAIEEAATRQATTPLLSNIGNQLAQTKVPDPIRVEIIKAPGFNQSATQGRPPRKQARKQARKRARKRAARQRTP
jgi:hypothetical protein